MGYTKLPKKVAHKFARHINTRYMFINLDLQSWNIQMQKLHFPIGGCEIRTNGYSPPLSVLLIVPIFFESITICFNVLVQITN